MINQKTLNCLATGNAARTVHLLQNRQVALQWERVTLYMRMTDLLTLNSALRTFRADPDRPWAATYVVALNNRRFFLHHDELYPFCALVQEATEQLPRRTVRWVDFAVSITPYSGESSAVGSFSAN
jgi:hypothetical protein